MISFNFLFLRYKASIFISVKLKICSFGGWNNSDPGRNSDPGSGEVEIIVARATISENMVGSTSILIDKISANKCTVSTWTGWDRSLSSSKGRAAAPAPILPARFKWGSAPFISDGQSSASAAVKWRSHMASVGFGVQCGQLGFAARAHCSRRRISFGKEKNCNDSYIYWIVLWLCHFKCTAYLNTIDRSARTFRK